MKRLKRRTIIALVLAAAFAAGMVFFLVQWLWKGDEWVGFFGSQYYNSGAIYDTNGVLLYNGETGEYAENRATRVATLHLVGTRTSALLCARCSPTGSRGTTPSPAPPWAATMCT